MAAAVLTLSGCATKGDIRALQTEVREELRGLVARQDSLMAALFLEAASTQDTLRTQSDQIFDFRGEITRQLRAIADANLRIEALAGENQRGIASLRQQMATLARAPVQPPTAAPDSVGAPAGGTETVAGVGGTPNQLWGVARGLHQRGSNSAAQAAYEEFLEQYPSHELAPDAHFNLADILTLQNRPEDALEAFAEIQTLYPAAAKVPDSLYRIAVIQNELGDTDDAAATLERIMNTYPDASIAMLARDLLNEIR